MAKELPYFRFTVQDWQNGKISLESFELQGLFISVCGYYWINDCSITLAMLNKKFRCPELMNELVELGILKHENRHDKIEIEFLNIQYDLLSEKRKLRQIAGSKGGNAKAKLKQKDSYKDKDNNKDNNKYKDNNKLVYPYSDLEFLESWNLLVTQPKWKKKTTAALQASLNKLANHSLQDAIKMINNSIAGGWQGIFELKENSTKFEKPQFQSKVQKITDQANNVFNQWELENNQFKQIE